MVQRLRLHASTVGGTGLIPGRGSFPDSWTSLIAQLVKNPPAMQKTLVRFLGQEDHLVKGKVTHCSILGLPLWLSW